MSVVPQFSERTLKTFYELIDRPADGHIDILGVIRNNYRLQSLQPGFKETTLIVTAFLLGIFVTQVNLNARDMILKTAERLREGLREIRRHPGAAFNVLVCVYLYLHIQ